MVKTINLGVYEILKKNEESSMYDILLCKECCVSCLRNNFSRHKNSPKHQKNFPTLKEKTIPIELSAKQVSEGI